MAQHFINPNWHIIFIHYPLGLLVAGILIELFSFFWRRSGFRAAGRWMILLGALASIPSALLGIYALGDVARASNPEAYGHWHEVLATTPLIHDHGGQAWHMLTRHVWYQVAATLIFVAVVVTWLACSDLWRKRLHVPLLVLLLAGGALMITGAWYGGESVYRHGVGVQPDAVAPVAQAGRVPATAPATRAAAAPAAGEQADPAPSGIDYYIMPVQLHVTLAGIAAAIALAALGLSIRRVSELRPADEAELPFRTGEQITEVREPLGMTTEQMRDEEARLRVDTSDEVGADTDIHIRRSPRTPAGRFWLLAAAVALTASLSGMWVLANDADAARVAREQGIGVAAYLRSLVTSEDLNEGAFLNRRLAHVATGAAIVLLPLVLAGLARWAPRAKLWLWVFGILLVLAVAVQVWLGVLLLLDLPGGPVTGFAGA